MSFQMDDKAYYKGDFVEYKCLPGQRKIYVGRESLETFQRIDNDSSSNYYAQLIDRVVNSLKANTLTVNTQINSANPHRRIYSTSEVEIDYFIGSDGHVYIYELSVNKDEEETRPALWQVNWDKVHSKWRAKESFNEFNQFSGSMWTKGNGVEGKPFQIAVNGLLPRISARC